MYELFTVHIWFAIAGGAIGGISAFYSKEDGKIRFGEVAVDFIISIVVGVGATSWLLDDPQEVSPFVYLLVSMFFGASSRMLMSVSRGALIEIVRAKAGDIFSMLLDAAAKRIETAQVKIESDKQNFEKESPNDDQRPV